MVNGWIAYETSADRDIDSEYFWALESVSDLTQHYSEWAWKFILATLAALDVAPNEYAFGMLGAGPLEDLLDDHGEIIIDRIEAEAQNSEQFRRLLGTLWESGSPEVWQRILAVLGKI